MPPCVWIRPFSTVMFPGPTCFQPFKSLPLNSGFHSCSGTRAATRITVATTTSRAAHLRIFETSLAVLRSKNVAKQQPDVCRTFGEPAHKPRIPVSAVSYKDTGAVALLREALLFGSLNAIEHLDFELALGNSLPREEVG